MDVIGYMDELKSWNRDFVRMMHDFYSRGRMYFIKSDGDVSPSSDNQVNNFYTDTARFSGLDDCDFSSACGMIEDGISIIEKGKLEGDAELRHPGDVMRILNQLYAIRCGIEILSAVFDLSVDNKPDHYSWENGLSDLVSRYNSFVRGKPSVHAPGEDFETEGRSEDGPASRGYCLEALEHELMNGLPADETNEIVAEMLERGYDTDDVIDMVLAGKARRERSYDRKLSGWLDSVRSSVRTDDIYSYGDLMREGVAEHPGVLQKYGRQIRSVQGKLWEMCRHEPLSALGGGENPYEIVIGISDDVNEVLDTSVLNRSSEMEHVTAV
jgi:hypothetical protein